MCHIFMEGCNMKLKELENKLIGKHGIKTGFTDDKGKPIGVDSFASFLVTKVDFPSNNKILKKFKDKKDFKPNDIKNNLFPKENFEFPSDYFGDKEFEKKYMFVGINAAFRKGDNSYNNWGNFRDVKRPTNTYKLYIQTNSKIFRGSYITDIIKNVIDSRADKVTTKFFGRKKLSQKDSEILNKSIEIFIQECLIVRPEKLILFGRAAEHALNKIAKSEAFKLILKNITDNDEDDKYIKALFNSGIGITHYATRMKLNKWTLEEPKLLMDKVSKK